jgi:hypothetical protein
MIKQKMSMFEKQKHACHAESRRRPGTSLAKSATHKLSTVLNQLV